MLDWSEDRGEGGAVMKALNNGGSMSSSVVVSSSVRREHALPLSRANRKQDNTAGHRK